MNALSSVNLTSDAGCGRAAVLSKAQSLLLASFLLVIISPRAWWTPLVRLSKPRDKLMYVDTCCYLSLCVCGRG